MSKIQKILNSPAGVATLIIGAFTTVYINVLQPMLGSGDEVTYDYTQFEDSLDPIPDKNVKNHPIMSLVKHNNPDLSIDLNALTWLKKPVRDPFRPIPVVKKKTKKAKKIVRRSAPILSAIISGSGANLAILDDKVVEKGNKVRGFTVTRIEPQYVSLSGPYGKVTLNLNKRHK